MNNLDSTIIISSLLSPPRRLYKLGSLYIPTVLILLRQGDSHFVSFLAYFKPSISERNLFSGIPDSRASSSFIKA